MHPRLGDHSKLAKTSKLTKAECPPSEIHASISYSLQQASHQLIANYIYRVNPIIFASNVKGVVFSFGQY